MFTFWRTGESSAESIGASGALPRVGCFGKLPTHADFINRSSNARELIALDHWIREGVQQSMAPGRPAPSLPDVTHHMVFPGSDDDRMVLGTLMSSQDSSGRRYPFAVAAALPEHRGLEPAMLASVTYGAFLAHTLQAMTRAEIPSISPRAPESLDAFCNVLGGVLECDTGISNIDVLASTSASVLDQVADAADSSSAALLQAAADGGRQVALRTAGRTPWGLRLPLSGTGEDGALVAFWLKLLSASVGQSWRGGWFWTAPQQMLSLPYLTVYFRPPSPYFFRHLCGAPPADGALQSVSIMARERSVRPSSSVQAFLSVGNSSLEDVLMVMVRRGSPV